MGLPSLKTTHIRRRLRSEINKSKKFTFWGVITLEPKCAAARDQFGELCFCSAHVIDELAKQMATGLRKIILISFCQVGYFVVNI